MRFGLGRATDSPFPEYVPALHGFAQRAGAAACAALRELGYPVRFHRKDWLLFAGSSSDHVLLLESGLVKVVLEARNGSQMIAGIYGPGELIGEQGVLFEATRSASVIAHTKYVDATRVDRSAFREFLRDYPHAHQVLYEVLYERLRRADRRQVAITSENVKTRVVKQLLAWAEALGEPSSFGVTVRGLSRKDLAQCVGANEKSVDAVLTRLTRDGLLQTGWQVFHLLAVTRLRKHLGDCEE